MKQQDLERGDRIIALIGVKKYDRARAELVPLIAAEPGNSVWWKMSAHLEYAADECRRALASIDEAIKVGDTSADTLVLRAEILTSLNRNGEAVDNATQALALEPNNVRAHLVIAEGSNAARGDRKRAVWHAKKARELAPEDPETHTALGLIFLGKKVPWANWLARRSLRDAGRLDPRSIQTIHAMAIADAERKRFIRAIRGFAEVLQEDPDSFAAQHNLSLALRKRWTRLMWPLVRVWLPVLVGLTVIYPGDGPLHGWSRVLAHVVTILVVLGAVALFVRRTFRAIPPGVRSTAVTLLWKDPYTQTIMIGQAWLLIWCLVLVIVPWHYGDPVLEVFAAGFGGFFLSYFIAPARLHSPSDKKLL